MWKELSQTSFTEGNPPPNELDVWREVARAKKGRIYGLGLDIMYVVCL